jgi:hypothetical protein
VIVHCCARDVPLALLRRAGAAAVSLDVGLLSRRADDAVGEAVDAGVGLFLGVVPATDPPPPPRRANGARSGEPPGPGLKEIAAPVRELWRRLGFAPERLAEQAVLTPTCGLAGASPGHVRTALSRCREAARMLYEAAG